MHNKKGFTLVEILAVVAILSILVTLVIPNVLKSLNNSKLQVLESESNKLKDSAALWIEDYCDNPIGKNECEDSYDEITYYKKNSNSTSEQIKYVCIDTLYESNIIDKVYYENELCNGMVIYDKDGKNGETYLYCGKYQNTNAREKELNLSYFSECKIEVSDSMHISVTLDANGGTVNGKDSDIIEVQKGEKYGELSNPIRPGYTFLGWYLKRDNNSEEYKITSDRKVTTTNDHILYAHWEVNNYIVTFKPNGGTVSPENKTVIFDEPYGEIPNPTRTGYEFKKWSYNGKVITKDTIVSVPNDHDILANYIPIFYTITYVTNSDSKCLEDEIEYDNEIVLDISLSKLGYTFKGWYTDSGLTNQLSDSSGKLLKNVSGFTNSDGKWIKASNVTVYAKWTPITYTIAYAANNGTGTIANSSHTYDAGKALTSNSFTKQGYTFTGWKDSNGKTYSDKQSVKNLTTTDNATITLTAQWKANTYYVAYDGNRATSGSMSNSTHTYDSEKALTTNGFTKTGYKFTGWKDSDGKTYSDKQSVKNLTTTNNGSITLYAQWTEDTYNVTYDGNGATSGSTSATTCNYGQNCTLAVNGYSRSDYSFYKWNTDPNGNGTFYDNGGTYSGNKPIKLYAIWKNKNVADNVNVAMYRTFGFSCKDSYAPALDSENGWKPFYNQTGLYWIGKSSGVNKFPWRIMVIEVPFNPGETASKITFTFTGGCDDYTGCVCILNNGSTNNCNTADSVNPLWSGLGESTTQAGIINEMSGKCMYSNLGLYNNVDTKYKLSINYGPNNIIFTNSFSGGTEGRNYYLYLFPGPDYNFPMVMNTWKITKN